MQRRVNLVTVTTKEVPVCNLDHVTIHSAQSLVGIAGRSENGALEGIPKDYVEDVRIPVKRFCSPEYGEKLLAIHPDVKRELAEAEAPELLKAVDEQHRKEQRQMLNDYERQCSFLSRRICVQKAQITKCEQAKWYTRIKWVFTGVKI